MIDIPVLVLAAGSAERFGSDKLLAEVAGQPLLAWTLELAIEAVPIDHVLVVVDGAHEERRDLCEAAGVATLHAPHADRGMRWSLQAGFDACPPSAPGAVVVLADDPLALRRLSSVLAVARSSPDRSVAVRRDPFLPHPVYLPRTAWPSPPRGDDDAGLRDLLLDDDGSTAWIDDSGPHPVDVDERADVALLERALAVE